ncbi:hypothetical protein [Streptomyces spiramyceticus]|uniref:hypothetical protein n=1 Tax=Streptomyces spiramyceticus TaxID=299717 RepID=UPI00237BAB1C|nr:hypothetical protein [Streptomyces spiramyceticus]
MTRGRRGAVTGATAAVVLCLGGVLAACGGGSDDGYVAVGAAGSAPERAPGRPVPPEGKVELVPLDEGSGGGSGDAGRGQSRAGSTGDGSGTGAGERGDGGSGAEAPGKDGGAGLPDVPGGGGGDGGSGNSGDSSGTPGKPTAPTTPATPSEPDTPGSPGTGTGTGPTSPATPAPPPAPAALKLGTPVLADGDKRWCERVTVPFRNTGGSPVRSGTVTFATHIIGALGVDWDTRESTQPLPGPIAAGAAVKKTYTVCVDAWRVPLGMHVETQDVTADWK